MFFDFFIYYFHSIVCSLYKLIVVILKKDRKYENQKFLYYSNSGLKKKVEYEKYEEKNREKINTFLTFGHEKNALDR